MKTPAGEVQILIGGYRKQIYRQFLSAVELVTPDSSGRILIPKRLLESAEIRQGIRFIGMGDYIEIWSSENTVKPFVSHEEFTDALEHLLSDQAPTSGGQPCGMSHISVMRFVPAFCSSHT